MGLLTSHGIGGSPGASREPDLDSEHRRFGCGGVVRSAGPSSTATTSPSLHQNDLRPSGGPADPGLQIDGSVNR